MDRHAILFNNSQAIDLFEYKGATQTKTLLLPIPTTRQHRKPYCSAVQWDSRPLYVFQQTCEEKYQIIEKRYYEFLASLSDLSKDPVRVFDSLKPKTLDELNLIREVSKELQIKKENDIKKSQSTETEDEQTEKDAKEVEEQTEGAKTDA